MTRVRVNSSVEDMDEGHDPVRSRHVAPGLPVRVIEAALRNPAVAGGSLVCGIAIIAIIMNALGNQTTRHPSPLFHTRDLPAAAQLGDPGTPAAASKQATAPVSVTTTSISVDPPTAAPRPAAELQPMPSIPQPAVARPRAPEPSAATIAATVPAAQSTQLIEKVQQGLKDRGFYTGAVDGIAGPATSEAIRAYERTKGVAASGEPTDRLLTLMKTDKTPRPATAAKPAAQAAPVPAPATVAAIAPVPPEPLTGSVEARMQKVQRALNVAGYGQIRADGRYDDHTAEAIRRYEAEHGMPITGMLSDRLVQTLLLRSAQAR